MTVAMVRNNIRCGEAKINFLWQLSPKVISQFNRQFNVVDDFHLAILLWHIQTPLTLLLLKLAGCHWKLNTVIHRLIKLPQYKPHSIL